MVCFHTWKMFLFSQLFNFVDYLPDSIKLDHVVMNKLDLENNFSESRLKVFEKRARDKAEKMGITALDLEKFKE